MNGDDYQGIFVKLLLTKKTLKLLCVFGCCACFGVVGFAIGSHQSQAQAQKQTQTQINNCNSELQKTKTPVVAPPRKD